MKYLHSLILKPAPHMNSLDTFVVWINQQNKQTIFNQDSIQNHPNIAIINQAGESIKIETVREIKEKLAYSAYLANQTRFIVFLDAHLTTIPAQNALLKSIEEPPGNTQLIFVTSVPQKLLDTIRSRCQIVFVKNASAENVGAAGATNAMEYESAEKIDNKYFEIINSNPGQKISIASKYKERVDAINLCNQLIEFLHEELKNDHTTLTTKQIIHNTNALLKTLEYLEHNTNVALTLENCFFELTS